MKLQPDSEITACHAISKGGHKLGCQHNLKTLITCSLIFFFLSGCGGGGGSDSGSTTPTNNAPVVDAGSDQSIFLAASDTETITLTGSDSDSDGRIVSRQWVQTSGDSVSLTGASTSSASFTVAGTTQAYSFRYTVSDNDGATRSDTVAVYVTKIIFTDTFTDDSHWTPIDDTGDGDNWFAASGQLFQTNRTIDFLKSYHLGTYARLDGSISGVNDYRFSVDIKPLSNGGSNSEGNDVGIMFRYDGTKYYRVSMNANYGFTRFEKYNGSSFQTLAVNAIGYVDNQEMNLTAEVNGDTIIVWIDGDPIFAVVDPAPIASGTVALYCQDKALFENVQISENPLQPTVAISTPLAYSIALTPDDGHTLSAEAVVLNAPAGGNVTLTLDDGAARSATASGNVYSVNFTSVADGEHEIMAILEAANGDEVSSDINATIGTGGDYYIAIGDSITNGVGDEDDSNNDSDDGRIVSIQGFQARLANRLTITTGLPQIVFNEGIEGDTAAQMDSRVASILERHSGANRVLMLIGTNDSDSGVTAGQFNTSVSATATKVDDIYGKQLWIAKIMPTYTNDTLTTLDAARNAVIQDYNDEIDSIVGLHADTSLGPDFYSIFLGHTNLYANYLHPNDAGYGVMADEWHDTLTP